MMDCGNVGVIITINYIINIILYHNWMYLCILNFIKAANVGRKLKQKVSLQTLPRSKS